MSFRLSHTYKKDSRALLFLLPDGEDFGKQFIIKTFNAQISSWASD